MIKKSFILYFLILSSCSLLAQKSLTRPSGGGSELSPQGKTHDEGDHSHDLDHEHNHEGQQAHIAFWRYYEDNIDTLSIPVDTMLHSFHTYNQIFQESSSNTYLGNYGSPYISNIYNTRPQEDFIFADVYRAYTKRPKDLPIINTHTPFTVLSYGTGGPKRFAEENVSVMFSQNIHKSLNIGAYYDLIYARGRYTSMSTRHRNYGFFSSYSSPRYQMVFNYGANRLETYENGGLGTDEKWVDALVSNPDSVNNLLPIVSPENFPVRFENAISLTKRNFISLKQKYNVGVMREIEQADTTVSEFVSALNIVHQFEYDTDIKQYEDKDGLHNFYDTTYINTTASYDSLRSRKISNRIGLYLDEDINTFAKFGMGAYLQMDNYKISTQPWISLNDSLFSSNYSYFKENADNSNIDSLRYLFIKNYQPETYSNVIFGGSVFKRQGTHFFFDVAGNIHLSGYNSGDWQLQGKLKQIFPKMGKLEISAHADFNRKTPSYYYNHYYSNNFWWDNNLKPTFNQHIGGALKIPTIHFEVKADINNMQDVIYLNALAHPDQQSGNMAVLAIQLKKDFELGKHLVWENEINYQESSNDIAIPLPRLTAYTNLYLRGVLFEVLHFNIGADCRYHTAYYSPGYMPATGLYYNQREVQVGDYPYMNIYADFFLRRMRFFFMGQHINYGWPSLEYFSAPHYAYNHRMFKLGLQWTFYD